MAYGDVEYYFCCYFGVFFLIINRQKKTVITEYAIV